MKFLSYGERRQLELALALNSDPKVLLLDEPCAGLSPSERQSFSRIISALPRDMTLVMIEHDIDIALALADRVTVLHRGRVILDGTPDEVQKDEQVREVYFGRRLTPSSRSATSIPIMATVTFCMGSASNCRKAASWSFWAATAWARRRSSARSQV